MITPLKAISVFRTEWLTWDEIGEKLDADPEAFRKRWSRARDRIVAELDIA